MRGLQMALNCILRVLSTSIVAPHAYRCHLIHHFKERTHVLRVQHPHQVSFRLSQRTAIALRRSGLALHREHARLSGLILLLVPLLCSSEALPGTL